MAMTGSAKHLLNAALTPTDVGKRTVNVIYVFPEAFLAISVLVFATPVVKALYLASDPLIANWFGVQPKVIVALPMAFVIAGYLMHAMRRLPSRAAIAVSLLGSSLALGVQANNIAVNALDLRNSFAASDCEDWTPKHNLEASWEAAHDFQKKCEENIGEDYLISHCPDYAEQAFQHPGWSFLENMEHRYVCSGWCQHRQPLWITLPTKDSCSIVVSQVLSAKVLRDCVQLIIYCFLVGTLTVIGLILFGPTMQEKGFDW
uniref:Uncharacterized protein n=1 Tax=Alexandrium andersonii TaxID=327968 RepID=A0A7S2MPE8_9DINO|mmetsp:Transcript_73242/g.163969  ORF Transcript_73242/g.163969 Transcript_73242/m.163969 type:complete len:260 (+) Transcript_73242:131-910(+)